MKTVLGCIRRADADFDLIAPGDRVAVGVSGGKGSLLLLEALARYRRFPGKDFSLHAITVEMGLEPFDPAPIRALCDALEVPYTVLDTDIAKIIFDLRREENPCALCARMRRGALLDAAQAAGCNRVALGHHREDAVETLFMSLIYEGRLHTFHPNTFLPDRGLAVIRPMVYVPEKHIVHVAKALSLPVVHNPCPQDGHSRRQEIKEMLKTLSKDHPRLKEYTLSALKNSDQYGLWDKRQAGRDEV